MSKKSIILLIVAIIFFVLAVGIFIYANNVASNENTNEEVLAKTDEENEEKFLFYDENENQFEISDFEGAPIALMFWSSDTENSYEIMEMIEKVYDEYKSQVTFLIINTEEPNGNITEIVANCGYSFHVYYDLDNLAQEYYSYMKLPTLIFYEEDGTKSNQIEATITEDSLLANLDLIAENY